MTLFGGDRALLDAYRRGETHALAAVYDAYVAKVIAVLRHGFRFESDGRGLRFRGVNDPLELESFVQDVFLRVFSPGARDAYDGIRPFEPFVLQTARNVVLDELRRRKRALERLVGPVEEEAAHVPDDTPPSDQRLDSERAQRLVRAFIEGRSEIERRYVEARFRRDLSQLAAARDLGITRMRARVVERRLLAALAKHLRQVGYLEADTPWGALALVLV